MAYLAHGLGALLLEVAEGGAAIGGVGGVAGDAGAGVGIFLLPFGQVTVEMFVEAGLGRGVDVAFHTVGIVDWLCGDGRLVGAADDPSHRIARADAEGMCAARKPRPRMAIDAAGRRVAWVSLIEMRMQAGQISCRLGLGAFVVRALRLGVARSAKGIVLFQLGCAEIKRNRK